MDGEPDLASQGIRGETAPVPLAAYLRGRRLELELPLDAVADQLNVPPEYVSLLESGKVALPRSLVSRYAAALGVSEEEFNHPPPALDAGQPDAEPHIGMADAVDPPYSPPVEARERPVGELIDDIFWKGEGILCDGPESVEALQAQYFGERQGSGSLLLAPVEALYLMEQGAAFSRDGGSLTFTGAAAALSEADGRLLIKYHAYRDWRDRNLIAKPVRTVRGERRSPMVYPAAPLKIEPLRSSAVWFPDSLFSVLEDRAEGNGLFQLHWFGQYGVYKQERGETLKLDPFETAFLTAHAGLEVRDACSGERLAPDHILTQTAERREFSRQLYDVYEDWRLRGFVLKSGFKFGSHFRLYFPGAHPGKEDYQHSQHVLHVLPKEQTLPIAEWSRAVRVAHSVNKTFLLGIPGMGEAEYQDLPADFLGYGRKRADHGGRENPLEDQPRFLMAAVAEDERIGGSGLASLLRKADRQDLDLLLSIVDRETAITYYSLRKIELLGSAYEYYEIKRIRP